MEGTRVGPYRIESELGAGGMGSVYLARVEEDSPGARPGERVALKLLHDRLLRREGALERFFREAKIGKSISHENLVRTLDVATLEKDGAPVHVIVMEYVAGRTLRNLLDALDRVPEELCRHIAREVARALTAIHEAGVVHRDVKPENVLVTEDETVKLMDLGVARAVDEALPLSGTGAFVGSMLYAAPEQFRSGGRAVDARADLYSLGITLYELATGRHPFVAEDLRVAMRRQLDEVIVPVTEVNPQVSPFFGEVLRTLLTDDPDLRFPTARRLVEVLGEGEDSPWWRARVRAIQAETKRPLARTRVPHETRLYGRDDEIRALRRQFARAAAGEGRAVLIEGEAGIGKSRLVHEFVGQLLLRGEELHFLYGGHDPGLPGHGGGAFATAYREHLGPDDLEAKLAALLPETPLLVPPLAALLSGETLSGEGLLDRESLVAVSVALMRALAAEKPLVLLVDDLHFAPDLVRELFLGHVLGLSGVRVLLVGVHRPGVPKEWTERVLRAEGAARLSLGGLDLPSVGRLLAELLGSESLAKRVGFEVMTESSGNPFRVLEIVRSMGDLKGGAPRVETIADLVLARMAHLEEEDASLLSVASCCGFEFDPAVVAEALGISRVAATIRLAHIEKSHRLVRSVGRHYAFDHHEVQTALHDSLPPSLREVYHLSLAQALAVSMKAAEREVPDLEGDAVVALCRHFLEAGRPNLALRYLEHAQLHLAKGYQHEAAVSLADRALARSDDLPDAVRLDVLCRKASHLAELGRRDEERATLDRALALAAFVDEPLVLARVRLLLGRSLNREARWTEAVEVLTLAARSAAAAGNPALEAAAEAELAVSLRDLGHPEQAQAHAERQLALAREIGSRQEEASGLGVLGNLFLRIGRADEARAQFERQLALAREMGDRRVEAAAAGDLATVLARFGLYDRARELFDRQLTLSREMGSRRGEAFATSGLGGLLHRTGEYDRALEHFERDLALSHEIGDRQGEGRGMANLGRTLLRLGRVDAARECFEQQLRLAREMGDRRREAVAHGNLGLVMRRIGRYEAALERYARALRLAREVGERTEEARTVGNLGRAWVALGRLEKALGLHEYQLYLAREVGLRDAEAFAHLGIAEVHGWCGDFAVAREHLRRCRTIAREIAHRHCEGLCLLSLGRIAEWDGDAAEAEGFYRDAIDLARRIGDAREEAAALAELGRWLVAVGRDDEAEDALRLAGETAAEVDAPQTAAIALCTLALVDRAEPEAAAKAYAEACARMTHLDRTTGRLLLFTLSGDRNHLEEACRLAADLRERAPPSHRERMVASVPMLRAVEEARREWGREAPSPSSVEASPVRG